MDVTIAMREVARTAAILMVFWLAMLAGETLHETHRVVYIIVSGLIPIYFLGHTIDMWPGTYDKWRWW